ncbi:ap-1 complex subunit mu-1-like protein [Ophiostoma piceae UAMH 11346]|uniref:Ap-1 complex subunit mu-1-like protein n=1 Tax=Ophiostoma piceae (strain UAMH 11346) TaxID=1262450 RepID=S3C3L2_OPHP1|nr:ap-1 complex subunit mu-1-like protein [Ophiostoma piceae UAMH 11346]
MAEADFSTSREGHATKSADRRSTNLTLPKSTGSRSNRSSSPGSIGANRKQTSFDNDKYFMQGSILPKLLVPLLFLGSWATFITVASKYTAADLTGFVVGLGLSFRSSTAYERYSEGRRYWAQLIMVSNALGRVFWLHAKEREEHRERDMLVKLTACKLVVAFAVALKHKLRFEPYTDYDDLTGLVGHLDTYAREATRDEHGRAYESDPGLLKRTGEFLGLSLATSNPRKVVKRAKHPLGNLPLEIINHLAVVADDLVLNYQFERAHLNLVFNNITALNDVLTGTERVLNTPLPIAYAIAINQITWLYVCLLPFQLLNLLGWITIPATMAAGYIILGLLFIGREVENPFGNDVNDLPLDMYCSQIADEIDLLASKPKPDLDSFIMSADNKILWPLSPNGWNEWEGRESDIRAALRTKYETTAGRSSDDIARREVSKPVVSVSEVKTVRCATSETVVEAMGDSKEVKAVEVKEVKEAKDVNKTPKDAEKAKEKLQETVDTMV